VAVGFVSFVHGPFVRLNERSLATSEMPQSESYSDGSSRFGSGNCNGVACTELSTVTG
jgi:hypothetical protein